MRKRRMETAALVLVCGGLAGLLIWSKLRLVSDLPRSAYADPRELAPGDAADDTPPGGGEQGDAPDGVEPAGTSESAPGERSEN